MQNLHKTLPIKSRKICSVPECFSYCTAGIYLHSYPVDEKLCLQWKNILKVEKPITKSMYVCSLHFQPQDYFKETPLRKRQRLKKGVIPSLKLPLSKPPMTQPIRNRDCPTQRRRLKFTAVPSLNLPKTSRESVAQKSHSRLQRLIDNMSVETRAPVLNEFKVDEIDPLFIESCSREPAKLEDRDSPDWVPSVNMGYISIKTQVAQKVKRHVRWFKQQTKRLKMDEIGEAGNTVLIIEPTVGQSTEAVETPELCNEYESQSTAKIQTDLAMDSTTKKSRKLSRKRTIPSRTTRIKSKKRTNNKSKDPDDHVFFGPKVEEFENDNKFEVCYLEPEKKKVRNRKQIKSDSETDEASESGNGFDFVEEPLDSQCQKTEKVPPRFQRLCRICSASSRLTHLKHYRTLVALFVSITNIEVKVEDSLPKYMCADCIQKLEDIANFICVAKKNDEKLRKTVLINEEMKIDLSDNKVDALSVAEDNSNNNSADVKGSTTKLSMEVNGEKPLGSDVPIRNRTYLPKNKPKKISLRKMYSREQSNSENKKVTQNISSEKQTSEQNDYYSDKKNDCVCWKCGEVYVGLKIPKVIQDLPLDKLKFHCLNCSKPNENDKNLTIVQTNITPFKTNVRPKVYPGKGYTGEEKRIRCITCSESFPVSEFVTHQLQTHALKKNYKCNLCSSSFSHPSLLRRHATRHT